MQRILFAVILALMMTLALVGMKRIATGNQNASQRTVVAEGGMPQPPIPW